MQTVEGLTATERAIYVPGFDDRPENGYYQIVLVANEERQPIADLFPQTMACLEACGVRSGVRLVAFGKQMPRTALHWHSDGRNSMLTAHLPLNGPSEVSSSSSSNGGGGERVPPYGPPAPLFPSTAAREGAAGMVLAPLGAIGDGDAGDEFAVARSWQAPSGARGNGVVFDTTFFHSAYNDGDVPADILFIDFFHPDLSDAEVEAIKVFQAKLREVGDARDAREEAGGGSGKGGGGGRPWLKRLLTLRGGYNRPLILKRIEPVRWGVKALWRLQCRSAGVSPLELGRDVELRSSEGRGTGAFALHDIAPGTLLGRYDGIMRSADDTYAAILDGATSNDYSFNLGNGWVVDGEFPERSNWLRYINHARKRANCLVGPLMWSSDVSARPVLPRKQDIVYGIYFVADKPIAAEEEIFFDYGSGASEKMRDRKYPLAVDPRRLLWDLLE